MDRTLIADVNKGRNGYSALTTRTLLSLQCDSFKDNVINVCITTSTLDKFGVVCR